MAMSYEEKRFENFVYRVSIVGFVDAGRMLRVQGKRLVSRVDASHLVLLLASRYYSSSVVLHPSPQCLQFCP